MSGHKNFKNCSRATSLAARSRYIWSTIYIAIATWLSQQYRDIDKFLLGNYSRKNISVLQLHYFASFPVKKRLCFALRVYKYCHILQPRARLLWNQFLPPTDQQNQIMSAQEISELEPPTKRMKLEDRSQSSNEIQAPEAAIDGNESSEEVSQSRSTVRLSETDCGIEIFMNENLHRFNCALKELTSDFQVFEVDTEGKIVKLEKVPKEEELVAERQEVKAQKLEKEAIIVAKKFDYESEKAIELKGLLGDDVFEQIKQLSEQSQDWHGQGSNAPLPVITPIIDDREKRTCIHKGIREVFLGSLETEAKEDKRMRISYKQGRQGGRADARGGRGRGRGGNNQGSGDRRQAWEHPGDYTIFTLYKDGRDTMEVAHTLSKALNVPPKVFGYAGTKDRRGCTTQLFSAYRTAINRLASLHKHGAMKNIVLGDFRYSKKQLMLGDLKGNRFVLVLRNIEGSTDEEINNSFNLIKDKGFVNYFGMQRFGSSSTGTHQVGIHILRGEFEQACDLILSEHSGAWKETKDAKLHWIETRDADKTLELMPKKCVAELAILRHISKQDSKNDYNGAFNNIPRNLRLMYMHAYQSLVWNLAVTQRLQRYGPSVIAGDLVLIGNDPAIETVEDNSTADKPISRARILSADEISQYSIYDVVLPMPGCDVLYPENEFKEYYSEVMKQENLDPFNMVTTTRETSLLGSYRKILSRPIDLEWQILKYTDEQRSEQLIATNLDDLQGKIFSLPTEGPNTAVKLSFQLESAAYATMMLREALSSVPYSV